MGKGAGKEAEQRARLKLEAAQAKAAAKQVERARIEATQAWRKAYDAERRADSAMKRKRERNDRADEEVGRSRTRKRSTPAQIRRAAEAQKVEEARKKEEEKAQDDQMREDSSGEKMFKVNKGSLEGRENSQDAMEKEARRGYVIGYRDARKDIAVGYKRRLEMQNTEGWTMEMADTVAVQWAAIGREEREERERQAEEH